MCTQTSVKRYSVPSPLLPATEAPDVFHTHFRTGWPPSAGFPLCVAMVLGRGPSMFIHPQPTSRGPVS